jgi:hypothetical protein
MICVIRKKNSGICVKMMKFMYIHEDDEQDERRRWYEAKQNKLIVDGLLLDSINLQG